MERLTLMAVHAHPDDEASSTGGILAKYVDEGVQTVLVTCTNGELGNAPDGSVPGDPGHDEELVKAHRRGELDESRRLLGISDLELLGYHDSGMMGWPQNDEPGVFWQTPVAEAAGRLATLMEKYQPDVVVTYDENGFYGHPDHIQAHRITVAAVASTGIPKKLYYPVIPLSAMEGFVSVLRGAGVEPPQEASDAVDFGTPDELIAAYIDCAAFAETKFRALEAHASQTDNSFFLDLGLDLFKQVFSIEAYVRAHDTTGHPTPEDDLFAGLR
ncbi:MAG: PIG-L family deacetylase [Acidimicrobiales bacterium]|jgi:LmbE family N-acetylglucosaminyl deacetylase